MNAFIILNYNDCDNCIRLATAVSDFTCIDKVIVVDNCSTDDSVFKLRQIECDKIKLVITEKNGGYSYGNNRGAEYAINELHADKLVFSNTDIIIEEDALSASLNVVGKDDIAYCTPIMHYTYKKERERQTVWYSSKWLPAMLKKTLLGTIINKMRRGKSFLPGINDVNHVCNALFVIDVQAFTDVGMFDENVFLYYEEDILFYKLRKKGYRVVADGDHEYLHDHGASTKKTYNRYSIYKIAAVSGRYYWFNIVKIGKISRFFYKILAKIIQFERFVIFGIFK